MSHATTLQRPRAAAHPTPQHASLLRKGIAVLMILLGVAFIGVTLAVNLFKVGTSFEGLTDGFRPIMTEQTIDLARQDVATLGAAGTEFQTKLAPAMAAQLDLTPAQLTAMFSTQFPKTMAGVSALPAMVPTFDGLVTTIDQQRPLFRSADAIPTKDLPSTTLPWTLLAVGVGVLALGAYTWFAPRRGAEAAVVVGALLVAAPFMLSLPQKAADADQMNSNLKPVYTQQLITDANSALATVQAMGTEMQTTMLPALAAQLKMQPAELQAFLGQSFPATAKALTDMPDAMRRFTMLVSTFQQNLSDYKVLKPVTLEPIVWFMIGGGALLLVLGAGDLFLTRKRFALAR
jgi:hypothetical protein